MHNCFGDNTLTSKRQQAQCIKIEWLLFVYLFIIT